MEIRLKSHIFIFCPELLNLHKRLSIQSPVIANLTTMSTICQHLYTLGVEVKFTRMWDFTWKVSDCEELVVPSEGVYRQKCD